MTLAERIERVLFNCTHCSRDEWPTELYSDVESVILRYRELKRTLDLSGAARQAKTEWLEKTIAEDLKRYVIIGMANDLQDDYWDKNRR